MKKGKVRDATRLKGEKFPSLIREKIYWTLSYKRKRFMEVCTPLAGPKKTLSVRGERGFPGGKDFNIHSAGERKMVRGGSQSSS